jgi:hypothetical protein
MKNSDPEPEDLVVNHKLRSGIWKRERKLNPRNSGASSLLFLFCCEVNERKME